MKKISLVIFLAIILHIAGYVPARAEGATLNTKRNNVLVSKAKPVIAKINSKREFVGRHASAPYLKKETTHRKMLPLTIADSSVYHLPSLAVLMNYNGAATTVVVDTALKGGIFILQTGSITPDYGITFSSKMTGKYWLRQIDNTYVLPEWFGALGNRLQDDAPYIQNAIAAANKNSIGQVILRNVSYRVSSTIKMKKSVSLTGSLQTTTTNSAPTRTILVGSSSLVGDAILYDFTNDPTTVMPYNSNLYNLNIKMDSTYSSSTGGCGVHLDTPKTGKILNGILISNVEVDSSHFYGFWNEANVNGVHFYKCYAARDNNHGFEMDGRDTQLDFCASYNNSGDGIYVKGNSLRVTNCDIFNNVSTASLASGNGIEDDGFVNFYENVVVNGNEKNGILLPTDIVTPYSGAMYFINCRVFGNSQLADTAYSDINVGSYTSASGKSVVITNSQLSFAGTLRVKYSISVDKKPSQMVLSDDTFYGSGLFSTSSLSLSPLVSQYAHISNCTRSTGVVGNTAIILASGTTLPDVSQGLTFQTNNSVPTTISNFLGGQPGQQINLIIDDSNTSVKFTGHLHGGDNSSSMLMFRGNSLTCYCLNDTAWYCILNSTPPALAPAYTFKANNTSSAATASDLTFKQVPEQTYAGTISWDGTAPATIASQDYTWSQIGNMVTLRVNIKYTTAGSANTTATLDLPSDCPTPKQPTGFTGTSNLLYTGAGAITNSVTSIPVANSKSALFKNASTGYSLKVTNDSVAALVVAATITYFTN